MKTIHSSGFPERNPEYLKPDHRDPENTGFTAGPSEQGETALEISHLNITYSPYRSQRIRGLFGEESRTLRPVQAVKDLSFSVDRGEVVGIIGRNGSGKTTLLRAIAGIISPDGGKIDCFGNRVSLMALGVGFDPELSGRDNIFLSGLMLGFSRQFILDRIGEIIRFSELEDFIEYPVRTYSSGMYARLAFSITSFLDTDIMLIDEVLGVGDAQFKEKSQRRLREQILDRRRTVLIVSHDEPLLERICGRILWMEEGKLKFMGETDEALKRYRNRESG